jgi:hypothetical protein
MWSTYARSTCRLAQAFGGQRQGADLGEFRGFDLDEGRAGELC